MASETDVKTKRALEEVSGELADAEAEMAALGRKVSELRSERDRLAVEIAKHPWLGKSVKRTKLVGYGSKKKPVTNRGTVTVYNPELHRGLRNVGSAYGLKAGEPIVIHPGGQTGWRLNEFDWNARALRCAWELDEADRRRPGGG